MSKGYLSLCLDTAFLLLLDLEQQRLVDSRKNTAERDSRADKSVQFFVTSDGELEVSRCDTLHLQILGGIARKFEYFGRQVFEDRSEIDGGCMRCSQPISFDELSRREKIDDSCNKHLGRLTLGSNTHLVLRVILEESLDTTARELRR